MAPCSTPQRLAYLRDEPGAEVVSDGAAISTVNLAVVFSRIADRGVDLAKLAVQLAEGGLLDGAITVEP